jgi:hypothetical protein
MMNLTAAVSEWFKAQDKDFCFTGISSLPVK